MADYENKFRLTGIVAYAPSGIGFKLLTKESRAGKEYDTTHDVLCFQSQHSKLLAGDWVTVDGDLGNRKTEYLRSHNGKDYPVYMTQLIARTVKKLNDETSQVPFKHDGDVPF